MSEICCNLLVHGKCWQVEGANCPFQVQLGEIFVPTANPVRFWGASFGGMGQGPVCCVSCILLERTVTPLMKNSVCKGENHPQFS